MIAQTHQPDALLTWMSELADPARVRLLRLIEQQELGVSDLCLIVQMPQSTVSRHLKILSDNGWVTSRRQATTNLYRLVLDELAPAQRDLWVLTRQQTADWATLRQDDLRLAARLAERTDDAKAFFAGAAADWDRTRAELYGEHFGHDALLSLLPSEWTVADLGCGTASLAAQLAPHADRVIGIDNSPEMLRAAKARVKPFGNVDLRRGELAKVPIDDAQCDAALCILVLTYIQDTDAVLQEMYRILKPGGRAVVIDLLQHDREDFRRSLGQRHRGFAIDAFEEQLKAAGFATATCRTIPPAHDAKGPALMLSIANKA